MIAERKGATSLAGGKNIRKRVFSILGGLVLLALLALAGVALILAKPQGAEDAAAPAKPSKESRPAVSIDAENDLVRLVSDFPAPVMSFMSGSGMTFVSATSADAALSGGFGRVATLYWQTPEGEPMVLQSLWPADALSLLDGGYHFTLARGPALFGSDSVRMENDESIRFHVATDQALYVLLLPRSLGSRAADLCRSLQLFTVNPEQ